MHGPGTNWMTCSGHPLLQSCVKTTFKCQSTQACAFRAQPSSSSFSSFSLLPSRSSNVLPIPSAAPTSQCQSPLECCRYAHSTHLLSADSSRLMPPSLANGRAQPAWPSTKISHSEPKPEVTLSALDRRRPPM